MNKPGKNENKFQDQGQETPAGLDHTGAYLRKLRTEKGLSIKEACEATRISEINLTAIENQDFAALPAETFTRGLLNIYARYLEADPAHVVARFMREREQRNQGGGKRGNKPRQTNHKILTPKKLAEPAHISSITMAAVLMLCIMVLFTGFCLYTSWNPFSFLSQETDSLQSSVMQSLPNNAPPSVSPAVGGEETAPSVLPATSEPQPTEVATAGPREDPTPTPSAQAPPVQALSAAQGSSPPAPAKLNTVSIEFLKNSRLTLIRDHEQPVSNLYKKGEKLSWAEPTSMQFIFDLPDSAVILVNGQPVSFPAETSAGYTLSLPADLPHPPGQ